MMQRRVLGAVMGLGALVLALLVTTPSEAVSTSDYPPSPSALETEHDDDIDVHPVPAPSEPTDFEANGVIVIDGVRTAVRVKREHSAGTFRITGRDIDMTLSSVGPAGVVLPLGADGSLLLIPGGNLQATGKGFAPTSSIVLWLLSAPVRLGSVSTDAAGSVTVRTRIPAGVAPGLHHAQALGYTPGGQELRATVPARVLSRPLEPRRQRVSATIRFGELDATVVPGERDAIDSLIAQLAPDARRIRVTVAGYVQPSSTTANDMTLSTKRAVAVGRYLRRHGVKGVYLVSGRGVSSAVGAEGRRAEVRVVVTVLR